MNGEGYYFHFLVIDVIKNGKLVRKIDSSNCENPEAIMRQGGLYGGIVTQLDFSEETMSMIQSLGAFVGMESGFDLYLFDSRNWRVVTTFPFKSIGYTINAGGIKSVIIVGLEEDVIVQINTTDGYVIQCANAFQACIE